MVWFWFEGRTFPVLGWVIPAQEHQLFVKWVFWAGDRKAYFFIEFQLGLLNDFNTTVHIWFWFQEKQQFETVFWGWVYTWLNSAHSKDGCPCSIVKCHIRNKLLNCVSPPLFLPAEVKEVEAILPLGSSFPTPTNNPQVVNRSAKDWATFIIMCGGRILWEKQCSFCPYCSSAEKASLFRAVSL